MALLDFIAERIRDLRTGFNPPEGLSQQALAKAIGTNANTISRWETGAYKPGVDDLEKLSRFFGVSILSFFPDEQAAGDERMTGLLRAAKDLDSRDLEELQRYAEFRRARSLYSGAQRPRPGRKKKGSRESE